MYVFFSFLFSLLLLLLLLFIIIIIIKYRSSDLGWDSVVSIATRYGVGGPGIECWWGRNFSSLGPTHPPVNGNLVSFPEAKRPGRGVERSPLSNSKVQKRVDLYRHSPSVPTWSVVGGSFPLLFRSSECTKALLTAHKSRNSLRSSLLPTCSNQRAPLRSVCVIWVQKDWVEHTRAGN